ncbi:selenocysteine lyase isoform X2 [Oryzias latipes]|uniref:selenocysteine lyase isoform X2 n=1 Tax=Oryzias latipes TaxID=8090 RepID=UPI000CE2104A|nr:selenocysteine lyase isoform X2 [Oryzias latipes]
MANKFDGITIVTGHTLYDESLNDHTLHHLPDINPERIYMDYNATTPLEPEVLQAVSTALQDAWGNPSSNHIAGATAKAIIYQSRQSVARMVGGKAEDIIFTSGGTEANNLVLHTAVEYFQKNCGAAEQGEGLQNGCRGLPHIITSNIEHDSIQQVASHLQKEGKAEVTFVPVSRVSGCIEVEDVIAAVRPNTCLISVMLANNETGVIMPLQEICQRVKFLNKQRERLRILLHTDAAQALGKIPVDVQELGVDYLTIVGHKFYAPRIGALFVNGPGSRTPLYPMLFGGGQERNFRPGTENTPMIAGLGKSVFRDKIRFNNRFPGSDILPNTINMSILGPTLQGWRVLSTCRRLLASVGAACHSASGNRPSHILLSCGVPTEVAANALRVSVGRGTTKAEVDAVVEDLRETVQLLEEMN